MWLVVANSSSGKGKATLLASEFITLLAQKNYEYKLISESTFDKTSEYLKSEIESGRYTKLVAVGGDGLVNLCLQSVAQKDITLGVIPAGTGNDFARAVGVNGKSTKQIFDLITTEQPTKLDLGKISSSSGVRWYVQVLSTGFDAVVNSLANKITWPKGKSKYTIATILIISRFKPISYKIEIDGKKLDQNAMLLSIGNGESYGGGMRICPGASNTDGLLDVLLVRPVSRFVLLTIFPKVFKGNHIPHPKIDTYKAKVIKIAANTAAYADGELVSDLPIEVSNVPRALNTWLAI